MATYAFVDGGLSTAEYMWANGIRPAHILFKLSDLEESLSYCDPEEDSVLCIVNGCVNFAYTMLKDVVRILSECETIKDFTIFSNVPIYLPTTPVEYVLFDGDLMVGKEYIVSTATKVKTLANLKALPQKDNRINRFKVSEATLDDVDIGDVPHHYITNPPDNVKRSEIVQINIFKKDEDVE